MRSPPLTCWTDLKRRRDLGNGALPATLFFSVAGMIFDS